MNCFSNLLTTTLKPLFFICIAILPTTVFSQGNEPPILATDGSRLFPYKLPLNTTSKPADITEGEGATNAPTGAARYTTSGVVLTKEDINSFSGFGIDKVKFISNYGLEIRFFLLYV